MFDSNEDKTNDTLSDSQVTSNEPEKKNGSKPWLLLIGLFVGMLGGFYLRPIVLQENSVEPAPPVIADTATNNAEAQDAQEAQEAIMAAVASNARHIMGDPEAPITMLEFADFNCGYCGKWVHETLPAIQEKYIDTGKVRFAYINYPVLGPGSMTAAQASECAAEQDGFWGYHNLLFTNQRTGFTTENLVGLAEEQGLDSAAFEQCLTNFPEDAPLQSDIQLGQMMGVRGTPAFLVNGVALAGAYPYDTFENVIETLLAENAAETGTETGAEEMPQTGESETSPEETTTDESS